VQEENLFPMADGGDAPDGGMKDAGTGPDGGMPDGGMPSGSGKQPHLINTITGEDYGLLIDFRTFTVYSERLDMLIVLGDGTMPPRNHTMFYYPESDCKGVDLILRSRVWSGERKGG
jgi:hypothetical protein